MRWRSIRLVSDTLGVLLKYQDDIQNMQGSRAKTCSIRCERAEGTRVIDGFCRQVKVVSRTHRLFRARLASRGLPVGRAVLDALLAVESGADRAARGFYWSSTAAS
jgi:hypothetical protein